MGDLNHECLADSFKLDRVSWHIMGEIGVEFPINNSVYCNHGLAYGWEGMHTIEESTPSCEK